jgi:hypothetical protein
MFSIKELVASMDQAGALMYSETRVFDSRGKACTVRMGMPFPFPFYFDMTEKTFLQRLQQ